ncbi:MAG TPA: class I SAM-dependent methyltransferase [Candidatus Acidoferrales bacterium]|nr:class I SAM-dependent methyltransferase [Candidatus Acidoferrales bacterium]
METLESVTRVGRERLYPSLTNPHWLVLRRRRQIFQKWIERANERKLEVLDIGGRIQPYRPLLEGRLKRYVAIDMRATPLVDLIARGEQMPLAAEKFDLVICTQVFQYVSDPALVGAEIHRVLKPRGILLLSAPAMAIRDADEDGWRFLPCAWKSILREFSEMEIVSEGGNIGNFVRMVNASLHVFLRYRPLQAAFRYTLCPLLNVGGNFLDRIAPNRSDYFSTNYSVWARK